MNAELLNALSSCETDISGALKRLSDDENLYILLLEAFVKDSTMDALENAVAQEDWDSAFTAAHALKGLAGNLGFVPLFHTTGELVLLIRSGRIPEIADSLKHVKRCYVDVSSVIFQKLVNNSPANNI